MSKWRFPSIRHNEIRDLTATLLTEVCHNVSIEPGLQPISNEILTGATTNTEDRPTKKKFSCQRV